MTVAMLSRGPVCVFQEAQLFSDLLGDHGKPVWPLWELIKWLVGMSSHTLPAIGKARRNLGCAEVVGGWVSCPLKRCPPGALTRALEFMLGT